MNQAHPNVVKADIHREPAPPASCSAPQNRRRNLPTPKTNLPQPPSATKPDADNNDAPAEAIHQTANVPAGPASIMVHGKLYDRLHLLGSGAFGTCYMYRHEPSGHRVAIKTMFNQPQNFAELTTHRQMHHPNIVRMLDELKSSKRLFLIMEPCLRSLQEELAQMRPRPMSCDRIRQLFAGALNGLAQIHQMGYVHRDIKLGNLLLRTEHTLQICDFGMAARRDTPVQMLCGTWSFLAPEVVARTGTVQPTLDVWAAGVCMYLCQNRAHPFSNGKRDETAHRIRHGIFERPLEALQRPGGAGLLRLLERMFVLDPVQRVTVEQVLADEFFASSVVDMMAVRGPTEQHFMAHKQRQSAAQMLHLYLGQKRPRLSRLSRSSASVAAADELRLTNVHALNFRPVWLCKQVSYDDRQAYRMRYNLSNGHFGVLYADESTILRSNHRELHHFDLDGDIVTKSSDAHVEFFMAVSHELRDFYGPDWAAAANSNATTDCPAICYVTGYLRTANVLLVTLSNQSMQVNVLDRRYLFSQYAAHEIVSGGEKDDDARAKVVGQVQVVTGSLPWPVLDELTKIVEVLLKIVDE